MTTLQEIETAIDGLGFADRSRLVAKLTSEAENEVSAEWREEIAGRAREIDEGKVELINGDDFMRRMRAIPSA